VTHEGARLVEHRTQGFAARTLEEVALRRRRQHAIPHLLQHELGELDHAVRTIGPRPAERDQRLDLGARLVRGGRDPFVDCVLRQVRPDQVHGGEMEPSVGERFEELRVRSPESRRANTTTGFVFGESQLRDAPGESGGVPDPLAESARVDLRDARDEERGGQTIMSSERAGAVEQRMIGEMIEREAIHRNLAGGGRSRGRCGHASSHA